MAGLVITDRPVPWLPVGVRVEAVGGDTGMAMDDVGALTDRGGLLALQAKGRLQLDQRPTSPLAAAVEQAVNQFRSGVPVGGRTRPMDAERDRVVILGNGTSSATIRALGDVTARLRTLPAVLALTSAAVTKPQGNALRVLLTHVKRAWTAAAGVEPSDNEVRTLLRVMVVDVLDLGDGEPDRETALVNLGATLLQPADADRAWNHLVELGRNLSVQRSWRRRPDIAIHLDDLGTALGPSTRYAADVRVLRQVSDTTLRSLADHAALTVSRAALCTAPERRPMISRVSTVMSSLSAPPAPASLECSTTWQAAWPTRTWSRSLFKNCPPT